MRRVYFIWGIRQLMRPFVLEIVLFALLLWQIKEAVFVRQVFANMAYYKLDELASFWSAAFLNTGFIVQASIVGIGILAVLFFKDFIVKSEEHFAFVRNI